MKKSIAIFLFIICLVAAAVAQDAWKLKVQLPVDDYYGITVANGMLGVVSSPEPLKVKTVVLSGLYDRYGRGRVSNFVPSFNLLNLRMSINGKAINSSTISNFRQELDMRRAIFTTSFDVGNQATVTYSYCALRHLPYCVLAQVEVQAKADVNLSVVNMMEAPDALRDVKMTFNEINRKHIGIQLLGSQAKSPTGKLDICSATSFAFTEARGEEPVVYHEMPDNNLHQMRFSKTVKSGQTYRFGLVGTCISSAHSADPYNESERLTVFARLEGMDRLLARHTSAWNELWKSDIKIEGDDQAQQDIHSMMYHLYSFVGNVNGLSVSPMGLSGLGYNGHVFWDADTWIFPALLVLHPELARSIVDYRFDRLSSARNNAYAHGFKGAMFPWESADSGVEETPVWALAGPFEHHISACVALAAWQYYSVSQDVNWLREKGWPLISETADFWISRAEKNAQGEYDIKNVVASDEWAENVDNDAFTNAAAQQNLRCALRAAAILHLPINAAWKQVADGLKICKFADGVTREHASYTGEKIKQADVNLLAYPLGIIRDTTQIGRDLRYYETRVPEKGTPAMTQAIFSLLYARLGNPGKALHFFRDAYEPNLNPPFRVIAETKGGDNPYFLTGAGGVLQTVLMGFGGLEITEKGLVQRKSTVPLHWKSVTITTDNGLRFTTEK